MDKQGKIHLNKSVIEKAEKWFIRFLVLTIFLCSWLPITHFNNLWKKFFPYTNYLIISFFCLIIILLISSRTFNVLDLNKDFKTLFFALLIYLIVSTLPSFFRAPYVEWAYLVETLSVPLGILTLGFALPFLFEVKDYDWLFKVLILILTIASFLTLYFSLTQTQSFLGENLYNLDLRGGYLVRFSFYNHRNYGGYSVQWLPAILIFFYLKEQKGRIWKVLALFIITFHIVFSFSRNTQLVAFLSLIPFFWFLFGKHKPIFLGGLVSTLFLFLGLFFIYPKFLDYLKLGFSLSGRGSFWLTMLNHWYDYGQVYFGYGYRSLEFIRNPHNVFLANLIYYGFIGFTSYLVILVLFYKIHFKNIKGQLGDLRIQLLLALTFTILIGGFFGRYLIKQNLIGFNYFWILMGMLSHKRNLTFPVLWKFQKS